MSKAGLYYCLILQLSIALTGCQNKTKTSAEEKDLFELINYPAWMDTLDCSRFGLVYKPYPCLELHKKNMQEVDSIYGKPLYISTDTLYYGWENNEKPYTFDDKDFEIAKMLSNVPIAIVTYTSRKDMGYILYLYFIKYDKQDIVFYGLHVSPHVMME